MICQGGMIIDVLENQHVAFRNGLESANWDNALSDSPLNGHFAQCGLITAVLVLARAE